MSARRLGAQRAALRLAAVVSVALAVAACIPESATSEGRDIAGLYWVAFAIGGGIIGLVWLLAVIAVVRNRAARRAEEPRQVRGSNRLEAIWTAIPILVVLGLFVGTVGVLGRTEAQAPDVAAEIDVEGFRWGWTFRYPEEGIEVSGIGPDGPEVVVPIGAPVRFTLRAADVQHSFYVPLFLFKRDVIPGRVNSFEVTVEEPGVYGGQCAEYCGIGHAFMPFTVRAVTAEEYAAWVEAARASSQASNPAPSAASSPPEAAP